MPSPETVAFARAGDYDAQTVGHAVGQLFEALNVPELIRPGMRVAVKPNLVMKRSPDRFTTTHPALVRAVAAALQALGADVVIADSPGGPFTRAALEGIYRTCGMEAVAKETGCRLSFDTGFGDMKCANPIRCPSFHIIRPILEADAVVNLPKLKTHGMVTLSAGVKNLFGCVPGLQKPELHYRYQDERAFCEMLVDLSRAVRPVLTVVDGIVAMEGDGPSGGEPVKMGILAGSRNVYALDAVLAKRTRLSPVPTVEISRERGLTPPEEQIPCLGEIGDLSPLTRPRSKSLDFLDRLPTPLRPALSALVQTVAMPRPVVTKHCIGCGKCAESCPADTIQMTNHRAGIRTEACIHCFCCHEMCPVGAIKIKRLRLFNL